jgi:tetratricopeptide (TPR) repeat protein
MTGAARTLRTVLRLVLTLSMVILSWASPNPASAMHGGHGGHYVHNEMMASGHMGYAPAHQYYYNSGFYPGYAVSGAFVYSSPLVVIGGGFAPFLTPAFPQGVTPFPMGGGFGGGLNLPAPPPGLVAQPTVRPRASSPARAKELTDIGDRSFRARNIKRAEDKYKLAVKADPTSPIPHVHLAQVSVARGNYAAAADHLRDAVTVAGDGAWLINVPDIQAIFGEPADFARQMGRLETHLQANPSDREAWFVLGAETYLSGRTRQAFDVFQRLTDRRTDDALTAFIDASRPRPAAN